MSSYNSSGPLVWNATDIADDLVLLESNWLAPKFTYLLMFTLIFFEYLITFDREVAYAWGRKLTWARAVFFVNRYVSLLQYFLGLVQAFQPASYFRCEYLARVIEMCTIWLFVVWAAFSTLRVFAIGGGGQKHIASVVGILSLVPVVTTLILTANTVYSSQGPNLDDDYYAPLPLSICRSDLNISYQKGFLSLSVLTRIPLVLAESMVIAVIVARTWRARRQARQARQEAPYFCLLLREGTLYFALMILVQTFQLTSDIITGLTAPNWGVSITCSVFELMQPIIISRFYLNLHDIHGGESAELASISSSCWKPLPRIPTEKSAGLGGTVRVQVHYAEEALAYQEKFVYIH